MQKITPCLWFDDKAEEAVTYYISIFKNGGIEKITYYGKEGVEFHKKTNRQCDDNPLQFEWTTIRGT